jgi:hypothetical protein
MGVVDTMNGMFSWYLARYGCNRGESVGEKARAVVYVCNADSWSKYWFCTAKLYACDTCR